MVLHWCKTNGRLAWRRTPGLGPVWLDWKTLVIYKILFNEWMNVNDHLCWNISVCKSHVKYPNNDQTIERIYVIYSIKYFTTSMSYASLSYLLLFLLDVFLGWLVVQPFISSLFKLKTPSSALVATRVIQCLILKSVLKQNSHSFQWEFFLSKNY